MNEILTPQQFSQYIVDSLASYGLTPYDFIYDVQDYLDDIANQHMIDRDGDPSPQVKEEPAPPSTRGKELGLANKYSKPQSFGKHWIK